MAGAIDLSFEEAVQGRSGILYRNLQLLGMGGNALTYLVLADSGPRRGLLHALKVFANLSKADRRERFLDEIRFLQDCDHPSIMRVFDDGLLREQYPFVVAEYLPKTLASSNHREFSTLDKINLVIQLLSALEYLSHQEPAVLHRDIKPSNIFIKGPSCVLGDFGMMKRLDQSDELDKTILKESAGAGMPRNYRSPDLVDYLRGLSQLTNRADLFQLGLVVVKLFTGRNPCKRSRDFDDPVELEDWEIRAGTQSELVADIVRKMLEYSPQKREPVSLILDMWQGLFLSTARMASALNGHVFPATV